MTLQQRKNEITWDTTEKERDNMGHYRERTREHGTLQQRKNEMTWDTTTEKERDDMEHKTRERRR